MHVKRASFSTTASSQAKQRVNPLRSQPGREMLRRGKGMKQANKLAAWLHAWGAQRSWKLWLDIQTLVNFSKTCFLFLLFLYSLFLLHVLPCVCKQDLSLGLSNHEACATAKAAKRRRMVLVGPNLEPKAPTVSSHLGSARSTLSLRNEHGKATLCSTLLLFEAFFGTSSHLFLWLRSGVGALPHAAGPSERPRIEQRGTLLSLRQRLPVSRSCTAARRARAPRDERRNASGSIDIA